MSDVTQKRKHRRTKRGGYCVCKSSDFPSDATCKIDVHRTNPKTPDLSSNHNDVHKASLQVIIILYLIFLQNDGIDQINAKLMPIRLTLS